LRDEAEISSQVDSPKDVVGASIGVLEGLADETVASTDVAEARKDERGTSMDHSNITRPMGHRIITAICLRGEHLDAVGGCSVQDGQPLEECSIPDMKRTSNCDTAVIRIGTKATNRTGPSVNSRCRQVALCSTINLECRHQNTDHWRLLRRRRCAPSKLRTALHHLQSRTKLCKQEQCLGTRNLL
jgi:hypothetical protein